LETMHWVVSIKRKKRAKGWVGKMERLDPPWPGGSYGCHHQDQANETDGRGTGGENRTLLEPVKGGKRETPFLCYLVTGEKKRLREQVQVGKSGETGNPPIPRPSRFKGRVPHITYTPNKKKKKKTGESGLQPEKTWLVKLTPAGGDEKKWGGERTRKESLED